MALPYPTKVVLPFDIATAQDMNERHANDVALANGSGLDDGAVTEDKVDFATFGGNTAGFIESISVSVNVTIPAGSWVDTGQTVPAGYLDGTWAMIPQQRYAQAGLYCTILGSSGSIYISSSRPSNATHNGDIRIVFIRIA